MSLNITDAAFAGFKLLRQKPSLFLTWGLFTLIVAAIFIGLLVVMGATAAMSTLATDLKNDDPRAILGVVGGMLGAIALMIPIALIVGAMMRVACYRGVLHPQEGGFGYIKLGADELRVAVSNLAVGVILLVVWMFPFGAVNIWSRMAMLQGANENGGAGPYLAITFLTGLLNFVWTVFFRVKLSLAPVMTYAEKHIRIFESWQLTKGVFWPLVGCYLLVGIIIVGIIIAMYVVLLIFGLIGFAGMAGALQGGQAPDFSSIGPVAIVLGLICLAVIWVVMVTVQALANAPHAEIYRQLKGVGDEAKVF